MAEFTERDPEAIAIGDLNRDGQIEVIVAAEGGVAWFDAKGAPTLFDQWIENMIIDDRPSGDGDTDPATTDPNVKPEDVAGTTLINSILVTDLDGDGADDLVIPLDRSGLSGLTNDALVWLRNNTPAPVTRYSTRGTHRPRRAAAPTHLGKEVGHAPPSRVSATPCPPIGKGRANPRRAKDAPQRADYGPPPPRKGTHRLVLREARGTPRRAKDASPCTARSAWHTPPRERRIALYCAKRVAHPAARTTHRLVLREARGTPRRANDASPWDETEPAAQARDHLRTHAVPWHLRMRVRTGCMEGSTVGLRLRLRWCRHQATSPPGRHNVSPRA